MKTILKPLSIIILIMALAGCAAQKSGNTPGKSTAEEVLYTQALKALEERNFIIKIDEFHFPSDKAPVNSTNSYVSMQGSHAGCHRIFHPRFPRTGIRKAIMPK